MKKKTKKINPSGAGIIRFFALIFMICLLGAPVTAKEETEETLDEKEWVSFFLICNEGMGNRGGNAGNTSMIVSMNPQTGTIRLMMFTWDSFIEYEGYDVPQLLDMAYRNNGPEETVRVFNANFDLNIEYYMSLNYLNMASLIDTFGGVQCEVTRAERNAINGMVASKKEQLKKMEKANLLDQLAAELLVNEYYLNDFGPNTRLNGLQAVGYGWLQYDSVYNCCMRDLEIVSGLFRSVSEIMNDEIMFYTDDSDFTDFNDGRTAINLDHVTDNNIHYLRQIINPIFQMSYNNLPEDVIINMMLSLARVSYKASKQGADIMDQMEGAVFPLEAKEPYENVAGTMGHLVDKNKNAIAMRKFLYEDDGMIDE